MTGLVPAARLSTGPSRFSSHRASTFQACKQRFAYRFVLKLQPLRDNEYAALGTLVGIGLMHYYLAVLGRDEALDWRTAMQNAPARVSYRFADAVPIVERYLDHWAGDPEWEILDVEREFLVTFGGRPYTQKADLVVLRVADGCVWLVDHKTSSRIDTFASRLPMDPQFLGYQVLGPAVVPTIDWSRFGRRPYGGVVANMISSVRDEYDRVEILSQPQVIDGYRRSMVSVLAEVERWEQSGTDPWEWERNYGSCQERYACDYLPLCRQGEAALDGFVQVAGDVVTDMREGSGK